MIPSHFITENPACHPSQIVNHHRDLMTPFAGCTSDLHFSKLQKKNVGFNKAVKKKKEHGMIATSVS